MSKQVIVLRGIPASGKSYWAKQLVKEGKGKWKRINKDDLRSMLDEGKYSKGRDKFVRKVRNVLLASALEDGYNVIIDDTNLKDYYIEQIKEIADTFSDVKVEIKWFPITVEQAILRDINRVNKVGANVIKRMYKDYVEAGGPEPEEFKQEKNGAVVEAPKYDPALPSVIIVDLDGTLVLNLHGRDPYDASTCDKDSLNFPVAECVRALEDYGYEILFVSGRSDEYKVPTNRFLINHGFEDCPLFMRESGDTRKDYIVKKEIYDKYIRDKYNVGLILDDCNQTVDMWRLVLGLSCFQVNYGDF